MKLDEATVSMASTEYLQLIAENNYFLAHDLKQNIVLIQDSTGANLQMGDPRGIGYLKTPVDLPDEIFQDFLSSSFIYKSGTVDAGNGYTIGKVDVYMLTEEGRKRGLKK